MPDQPSPSFKPVIHAEPEGGYWAEVPELPGCFTKASTLEELYNNLAEAIGCHLELPESIQQKVERSLAAAERGEILSQDEVEGRMARWL